MKTIEAFSLKPGDILLFPTRLDLYQTVQDTFGKWVADTQMLLSRNEYIHAEIVYSSNYVLAATGAGTHIIEHNMQTLSKLTILRHPKLSNYTEIQEAMKKYWNVPYDYTSLVKNGVAELGTAFGLEKLLEDKMGGDNKDALICSEAVARVYREIGLPVCEKDEWCSPQDLYESPYLEIIYKSPYAKI